MTIRPAAGPLIVIYEPLSSETTTPPMMAEMIPAMGGMPEARAIPRLSGSAIRKTTKPATASVFQFWTRPGSPSFGVASPATRTTTS